MLPITRKHLDAAEETLPFKHGKSVLVRFGEEEVWRSDLSQAGTGRRIWSRTRKGRPVAHSHTASW